MTAAFTVAVYDQCGPFAERHVGTLADAAAAYRRLRDANPGFGLYVLRNGDDEGRLSDEQAEWFENEVEAPGQNGEAPR